MTITATPPITPDRRPEADAGWSAARRGRAAFAAVALASVLAPLAAEARTGDTIREGVRNGTASQETEIIGSFDVTGGAKGGYVTRQSNTKEGPKAGGAAIYGCRAAAGGSLGGSAPCLRATNLANGFAFEFAAKGGAAGAFFVDDPQAVSQQAPFLTNARGLVKNLNAERVGGLTAQELISAAQQGGQPGQAGAGVPGPKGDKGDRGPSNGYAIRNGFLNLSNDNSTEQTLRTLSLPENGSYMVSITAEANWQSGSDIGNMVCRARSVGSNVVVTSTGSNLGATSAGQPGRQPRDHYAMTFPYTRNAGNTGITLTCQHGGTVVVPGIAQVQNATITAIQVADLVDQTP